MGQILSVNLAVPEPNSAKAVGTTGINTRPVDGPVLAAPVMLIPRSYRGLTATYGRRALLMAVGSVAGSTRS